MNNSIKNIGERIRAERLRSSMTQTELAGDRVSRNMLSMIESGAALPSIETLEYFANKLDVPAGIFFSDSDEAEALYKKTDTVTRARALLAEGRYEECANTCRAVPYDDELYYLTAEAEIKRAEQNMDLFMLTSAVRCLESAGSAAAMMKFVPDGIIGTIDTYSAFISFASGNIDINAVSALAKRQTNIPAGTFVYLTVLGYLDRGEIETAENVAASLPFMIPDQMKYLSAKAFARDFKFTKAIEMFKSLEDSKSLGFISKYRIAADIEGCYENKRDFESAYKYSSKKHHILELFSK